MPTASQAKTFPDGVAKVFPISQSDSLCSSGAKCGFFIIFELCATKYDFSSCDKGYELSVLPSFFLKACQTVKTMNRFSQGIIQKGDSKVYKRELKVLCRVLADRV